MEGGAFEERHGADATMRGLVSFQVDAVSGGWQLFEMKRTSRLFALTEVLRGRRTGITAEELADRFGVSLRTMYRDLDALKDASLPLHSERGRGGGFALDRSYTLPPVNFSVREAMVLLVLGKFASHMRFLPFDETLASSLDKVRAALPKAAQSELESALQFVGVPAHAVPAQVKRVVEDAWFASTPVRLRYRKKDGSQNERAVRIESIVLERTETLLNCVDVESQEKRQLRLHQVERAEVVGALGVPESAR